MSEETIYKAQEKIKLNAETSPAPWILIGAGTVLLLASIFNLHLMDYLWPGFILLPGLLMMVPAYKSTAVDQSRWSFLAVPGAVFLMIGGLTFVMNIFDHFEAWAYCWPMIPAAVAAGVLYMTRFDDNKSLEQRAHKFIRFMVMMLVGLAFFFEIIVFENFNPLMSIGLILFGLYLLRQDRRSVKSAV
ncbi:MAG: hypothetical protein ACK2T4_04085 [Candidatus Promineifilaceae bacterium]|jgi:hypothetical protein